MSLISRILVFLAILSVSDCRVKFTHSSLYDESDFVGKTRIEIEECSSVKQCALFVSILDDPKLKDVYAKIQMSPEVRIWNVTLTQFNAMRNETTKEINPYFITDGATEPSSTTYFYNDNEKQIAAPLVIYAVNFDNEPNYASTSGIFDAANIPQEGAVRGKIVTILSATPFTVTLAGDKDTVATVFATGFDNAAAKEQNADSCKSLLQTGLDSVVQFQINGPIASIWFGDSQGKLRDSKTNIKTTLTYSYTNLDLSSRGFVTSQGFIGCKSGQTYSSSLYGDLVQYSIFSKDSHFVQQSVYVNTDDERPVNTHTDNGLRNFNGNALLTAQKACDETHKLEVNFDQTKTNSFALLYYYTDSCDTAVTDVKVTDNTATSTTPIGMESTTSSAIGIGLASLLISAVYTIFLC